MACNEIMNNANLVQHLDHDDHHRRNESDDHDALSFCDLMMNNDHHDLPDSSTSEDYDDNRDEEDNLFEFLTRPDTQNTCTDNIVFCGKTIVPPKDVPRKGLFVRRDSFKKCYNSNVASSSKVSPVGPGSGRSSSFRFGQFPGPKPGGSPETRAYSRSSSGGSRKQKMFIGLVMRVEPKMELNEIRKRQGRRSPARLFPATGRSGEPEERSTGSSCNHHNWGRLRPLWCRAHFMTAFTKASFGLLSQ